MYKMFKLFVLICEFFFILLCSAQNLTEIAQYYCNTLNCPENQSIACQYTQNASMKCEGLLLDLNISYIVDLHNSKRNIVALGDLPEFEPAINMIKMQWDAELELMAIFNVMTCQFAHDECRNTDYFDESGQNLYSEWLFGFGFNNTDPNDIILNAIESWFIEYKDANMSYINNYTDSEKQIGHFTEMVRNKNGYVGCALNQIESPNEVQYLFACNYQTTNFYEEPVYIAGPTASQCLNGINSDYPGLCQPF